MTLAPHHPHSKWPSLWPADNSVRVPELGIQSGAAEDDWRTHAACLHSDPELFFLPDGRLDNTGKTLLLRQAKAVCERCPVTDACLDFALVTGQQHGVWGGLEPDERRLLRRRRQRASMMSTL